MNTDIFSIQTSDAVSKRLYISFHISDFIQPTINAMYVHLQLRSYFFPFTSIAFYCLSLFFQISLLILCYVQASHIYPVIFYFILDFSLIPGGVIIHACLNQGLYSAVFGAGPGGNCGAQWQQRLKDGTCYLLSTFQILLSCL